MGGSMDSTARSLRKHPTEAERLLWRHLRLRQLGGWKFRRQQPVGPYIVDFVCLEARLIVSPHLNPPPQGGRRQDATATAWTVNFNNGNVNNDDKSNNNLVRAVRGGL